MGHRRGNQRLRSGVYRCPASYRGREGNSTAQRPEFEKVIAGRGPGFNSKERGSVDKSALRDWVLGYILSSAQKDGGLAAHSQSQTTQRVHSTQALSNAMPFGGAERGHQRQMGDVTGPEGRVPACPYSSTRSEVAPIQGQRSSIRVQVPTVRPLYGSEGFHTCDPGGGCICSGSRRPDILVSGRLDCPILEQRGSDQRYSVCSRHGRKSWGSLSTSPSRALSPLRDPYFWGQCFIWTKGRVFPSDDRILNLISCVMFLLNMGDAPAIVWLKILGLMASMVDLVPWCRFNMRPVQLTSYVLLSAGSSCNVEGHPHEQFDQGRIGMVDRQRPSFSGCSVPRFFLTRLW